MNDNVKAKLENLPDKPGVYLFKDAKEKVLYVGKAISLKRRVRSYFQSSAKLDVRKSSMVKDINDLTFVLTENEVEALALEANFIKQYRPKYNIILRDDKNYPYLRVTVKEDWPKVEVVRRFAHDGNVYIGPYVSGRSYREALDFVRKHFPVRTCKYKIENLNRACVEYQIGNCGAPCAGYISKAEYMSAVWDVIAFLKGTKRELLDKLISRMNTLSEALMFEEAALVRDRIRAIENSWTMQKVVDSEFGDIDVIGCYPFTTNMDCSLVVFNVFFIRNGVLIGVKDFSIKNTEGTTAGELLYGFIQQFYNKEILPPAEIIVRKRPLNIAPLKKWLKNKRSMDVEITVPKVREGTPVKEGKKAGILKMAEENAKTTYDLKMGASGEDIIQELAQRLGLLTLPRAIGAFDISTISGAESVGAFICYKDGRFQKELYRKVKIKTVTGVDDYAMMKETVERVCKNLGEELPELIIIDGGKGQLEAAICAFNDLRENLPKKDIQPKKEIQIVSLAKNPDRIFIPGTSEPINLEDGKPSSFLLKRIRDEVHRSAITYHRQLRQKRIMSSPLEAIKGVSKARRLMLLKHFESLDAIRRASVEEIAAIKGFNKKLANDILEALQKKGGFIK